MHCPVLLQSTIELMDIKAGETVVDATLGLGGHAQEIIGRLAGKGIFIGLEADANLLAKAEKNLKFSGKLILVNDNFRNIESILTNQGIEKIDKILFDLGLNSEQFDLSGRGFTFRQNEPLLMTLNSKIDQTMLTAREIVNYWEEEKLADLIYLYGEERFAKRIARAIILSRQTRPIETTFDLVEIIKPAVPIFYTNRRIHFATKTFQALRMAVNDEINALVDGLTGAWQKLSVGGRVAALSFHSLESRTVKNFFKDKVSMNEGRLINKKIIKPARSEILANPRSRSAQLRVIEKI